MTALLRDGVAGTRLGAARPSCPPPRDTAGNPAYREGPVLPAEPQGNGAGTPPPQERLPLLRTSRRPQLAPVRPVPLPVLSPTDPVMPQPLRAPTGSCCGGTSAGRDFRWPRDFRRGRAGARGGGIGGSVWGVSGPCAVCAVPGLSLPPALPAAGTEGSVGTRGPTAGRTKWHQGPEPPLSPLGPGLPQGQEPAPRPPKGQRTRHRVAPAAPAAFIASSRADCGTSPFGASTPLSHLPPLWGGHTHPQAPHATGKAQAREGPAAPRAPGRGLRSGQGTRPPLG